MVLSSLLGRKKSDQSESFTIIVDAGDLAPYENGEPPQPRVKLEILQLLSRIAEQEDWKIEAVFVGEELPKVGDGGDFMGVLTFFAPDPAHRATCMLARVAAVQRQGGALLVTDDPNLEERAEDAGATVLRAKTFKKGFESMFTVRRRPQSRLMRRRSQMVQRQMDSRDEDADGINDLIDLVE